MRRGLVLLTEIIAPYRIPVFNALSKHDEIDLRVIFLTENDPVLRQWQVYRDEIRFSYQVLPSWRRRLGEHNILVNHGLKAALRKSAPDVIVCGGYNYLAAWQSLFWARRNQVPFLLWVESTLQDLRAGKHTIELLKKKFMRDCNAFLVPGTSSFEYVKTYGVSEASIFTAPNAVDSELFASRAMDVRENATAYRLVLGLPKRFFLFVGRLVPEKGVFELLQAYGTLSAELRAEIGLVFVGDGSARLELSRHARATTPGTVQFAGFVQRDGLPSYYGLAEAFVFPTHSDPWGLVVNEAMACGLPIIVSSAAGCAADLVDDGWNGRVVRPRKVEELASAMTALAQGTELRVIMGRHSRERIFGYSPEACAAGIARAVASQGVSRHE
jgi:glycosyltransferase involved in cell wall biosynthesis